jgi:hypothetical protein
MIEKENEYIHYRVTWFCTLQGLLLAALSFASSQPKAAPLLSLLCALGIAVAIVMFHPIYYAHRTMMNLLDWWDAHKPPDYNGPDVIGGRPKYALARHVGPWHALPALFFAAWCIIWTLRFRLS